MKITPISAFKDNYIWAILNKNSNGFSCVDPGDAAPVINYASQNKIPLNNILITHHHSDHAGGVAELTNYFPNVKVYGPEDARIFGITDYVKDGSRIQIENFTFNIMSIPGHTATHICYLEKEQGWLFCGDTLFSAGCGRVFDGTIEQLHHSIQLLKALDEKVCVFCGHEYTRQNIKFAVTIEPDNKNIINYLNYLQKNEKMCSLPSTIGLERKINPFMRTQETAVIDYAKKNGIKLVDSLQVFKLLRKQKDAF